jgi:hypothetical protein
MRDHNSPGPRRSPANNAIYLWFIALLAYPTIGIVIINLVVASYAAWIRVAVGLFIFAGFFVFLRYLYRWSDRIGVQRRAEIRQSYRGIYRVKAPPASHWAWLKENITIGDYGWERPPWRNDDLIYLHGLQEQWGVVWMAGFRREDVEYVGPKPVSEYDWREFEYDGPKPAAPYQWGLANAKSACPFPVSTENRRVFKWRFPV